MWDKIRSTLNSLELKQLELKENELLEELEYVRSLKRNLTTR